MWKICIFSVFLKHENVKCLNAFLNRMIHNDSDLDIICLFLDLDETLKVQKKKKWPNKSFFIIISSIWIKKMPVAHTKNQLKYSWNRAFCFILRSGQMCSDAHTNLSIFLFEFLHEKKTCLKSLIFCWIIKKNYGAIAQLNIYCLW